MYIWDTLLYEIFFKLEVVVRIFEVIFEKLKVEGICTKASSSLLN